MVITCNFCNKEYKSYQSRCNHIRKYHKNNVFQEVPIVVQKTTKCVPKVIECVPNENTNFNCKYCNKNYANRHSKWKHQQKCNNKDEKILEDINKLMKSMKIHPKTLQKINNELANNVIKNQVNNNTVNNTINNISNTVNNNFIIPLIDQNLKEVLKKSEKMEILNSGSQAHIKLTDILYNKPEYKPFRHIYITNMTNNIGYVYEDKKKCFIVKTKKDILDDYGIERFSDIQYFYEELEKKINENQLSKLKKMVTSYFNDNDFKDRKNKEMLIELYNNRVQVQQIYETINKTVREIEI